MLFGILFGLNIYIARRVLSNLCCNLITPASDKVSPFIVRNAALLKAGQVLVADGYTLNFQVINPFTGKPCRATLLGFLDWKSGGLVGYDIMLEECTQNIASALRNAILKMDHIPEYV